MVVPSKLLGDNPITFLTHTWTLWQKPKMLRSLRNPLQFRAARAQIWQRLQAPRFCGNHILDGTFFCPKNGGLSHHGDLDI